jgi:hypothetical protein
MEQQLETLLQSVRSWPKEVQDELVEVALDIEARRTGTYHAASEELAAIDDADRSGIATEAEVEAAFATFRRT